MIWIILYTSLFPINFNTIYLVLFKFLWKNIYIWWAAPLRSNQNPKLKITRMRKKIDKDFIAIYFLQIWL